MTPLDTIQAPFKALANAGIFLCLTLYHSAINLGNIVGKVSGDSADSLIFAIALAHIVMLPIALIIDFIFAAPALVAGADTAYNAKGGTIT